ncbi:Aspartyl protease family protein 1 [Sesamum angolense]|uniref:Aspartyl protease family protein 1 n=1 Tax=Sesamum angolense TaxID=2727404 RepID=A0AAE1X830_9LAMI|nr:Aspartyl protease family protein 1 [Sesamum angolense]
MMGYTRAVCCVISVVMMDTHELVLCDISEMMELCCVISVELVHKPVSAVEVAFACWINAKSSEAFGTFGFDIHHRYSDTVKDFLDVDGLPAKGSLDYYSAMAHRDQLFKARRLATSTATTPVLTFFGGNDTFRLSSLGLLDFWMSGLHRIEVVLDVKLVTFLEVAQFDDLHYAIVAVGTPPLTFLVALDTGSDLFWLPCDCTNCVRSLNSTSGKQLDLNIYSPSTSSTSQSIPCNSTMCGPRRGCAVRLNACAYQEVYLSSNTSSTGILVDDVLHLGTDQNPQGIVEAPITLGYVFRLLYRNVLWFDIFTADFSFRDEALMLFYHFRCGMIQTGDFLDAAAINGLFGLGMDNVSVPSILASKGLTANSFSMCFGPDGIGRIEFGDKGSPDQSVTPFNIEQPHPSYNVTVTQISVESNVTDLEFTAIFDSGTSFTYLNDPAYSVIVQGFDAQITEPRYQPVRKIIFDYCYELSATQTSYVVPNLNFTMKGGNQLSITAPTIVIPRQGGYAYCLAVVKSADINIIGQNFMTGYRMVFDREEMVLGWTASDCYDSVSSNNGSNTLPVTRAALLVLLHLPFWSQKPRPTELAQLLYHHCHHHRQQDRSSETMQPGLIPWLTVF